MSNIGSSHQDFLERLKSGDKKAVSWLYDQYSAPLYGVIYRMVKSHPKAELILEETFMKCLGDFHLSDKKISLFTCMVQTARSLTGAELTIESESLEQFNGDTDILSSNGYLTLVEGLDTQLKEVVRLVYVEGQSLNQVAQSLNIPSDKVRADLRCAIVKINANRQGQFKIA